MSYDDLSKVISDKMDGAETMTVLNDEPLNNAEFGRYFYGTSSYMGNGLYEMKYTALREGAHKLFVKAEMLQHDETALKSSRNLENRLRRPRKSLEKRDEKL